MNSVNEMGLMLWKLQSELQKQNTITLRNLIHEEKKGGEKRASSTSICGVQAWGMTYEIEDYKDFQDYVQSVFSLYIA